MNFILFILCIILLVILLFFVYPIKIQLSINSQNILKFNLHFTWLKSLISGNVFLKDDKFFINVYFFKKNIYSSFIHKKNNSTNMISLIKNVHPTYIKIDTSYGFIDPSITGLTYGIINLLSDYLGFDILYNNPDFNMSNNYFKLNAIIEFKLTLSVIKILLTNKNSNTIFYKTNKGGI